MKTECFCIYCSKHPLYESRKKLNVVTNWRVDDWPPESNTGKEVDCLEPVSNAFDDLGVEPESFEYLITAYSDGCSETGIDEGSYIIRATCSNEDYEGGIQVYKL